MRRTEKSSQPESIETILRRFLKANQARARVDKEAIFRRWENVVGEDIASHTRVVDLQAGTLTVEVSAAALLHDLSTYYSGEILESLQEIEEFRSIRELRFRAGSF